MEANAPGIRGTATSILLSRSFAYTVLCLVCSIALWLFTSLKGILEECFKEFWDGPNDWYLQEFRPSSAEVWNLTRILTSSAWYLCIPLALLILVGVLNARLSNAHARYLDLGVGVAWLTALAIGSFCLMHLMLSPLCGK